MWPCQLGNMAGWIGGLVLLYRKPVAMQLAPLRLAWKQVKVDSDLEKVVCSTYSMNNRMQDAALGKRTILVGKLERWF